MGNEIIGVEIQPGLKPERTHHDGNLLKKRDGKKSVLIQVDPGVAGSKQGFPGRYVFVPEDMAAEKVKKHEAVYVTPRHPDYLEGVKQALGRPDGFAPGEAIMIGGKVFSAEQIGLFNAEAVFEAAKKEVEGWTDDKEKGIIVTERMPMESFLGKKEDQRFSR